MTSAQVLARVDRLLAQQIARALRAHATQLLLEHDDVDDVDRMLREIRAYYEQEHAATRADVQDWLRRGAPMED